jgi:flagella basal body P-ring formation protein FlgA
MRGSTAQPTPISDPNASKGTGFFRQSTRLARTLNYFLPLNIHQVQKGLFMSVQETYKVFKNSCLCNFRGILGVLAMPLSKIDDKILTKFSIVFVVILTSTEASAITKHLHDTTQIESRVSERAQQLPLIKSMTNPTIKVNKLDPRLKLALCQEPLKIEPASTAFRSGRLTMSVRCQGQRPWGIYVPVVIESEIQTLRLNRSIARGSILTDRDISVEVSQRAPSDKPLITNLTEVVGLAAKRALPSGTELTHVMLEQPLIIKRGQHTLITAGRTGLDVQMTGKALQDGAIGEFIRVQNLSSKRTIQGQVQQDGSVVIARW